MTQSLLILAIPANLVAVGLIAWLMSRIDPYWRRPR